MGRCTYRVTATDAINNSSAIFLGQVAEIKTNVTSTPGLALRGSGSGSVEESVKFQVLRSWKLVDTEFVWVRSQGLQTACGKFEEGQTYLVYADELSGVLYVSRDSRTMRADEPEEAADITALGSNTLALSAGEFQDNSICLIGTGVLFLAAIILAILVRHFYRGKLT